MKRWEAARALGWTRAPRPETNLSVTYSTASYQAQVRYSNLSALNQFLTMNGNRTSVWPQMDAGLFRRFGDQHLRSDVVHSHAISERLGGGSRNFRRPGLQRCWRENTITTNWLPC